MGMFTPQASQMPKCPLRMASRAYSMRINSRLSTSASCELISSWTESRAASTISPDDCALSSFKRLKSPARALRNASRRRTRTWRNVRIASLRLIETSLRCPLRAALKVAPLQSSRRRTPLLWKNDCSVGCPRAPTRPPRSRRATKLYYASETVKGQKNGNNRGSGESPPAGDA